MLRFQSSVCPSRRSRSWQPNHLVADSEPTADTAVSADAKDRTMRERGYKPMFNGSDLSGWRNPYSHGEAKIVGDEIHLVADKKFFLVTEKQYADFRMEAEIKLPAGPANSGIMFRCHVEPNRVYGYQAECDGSERRWSAGLYDEGRRGWIWPSTPGRSEDKFLKHEKRSKAHFAKPEIRNALKRDGWNRFVIECRGNRLRTWLNGVMVTDFRDSMDSRGYIAIQHHGEKGQVYRFRNLYIKELPEIPAADSVELVKQQPVSVTSIGPNSVLVDFGKVAFGNVEITLPSVNSGERHEFTTAKT